MFCLIYIVQRCLSKILSISSVFHTYPNSYHNQHRMISMRPVAIEFPVAASPAAASASAADSPVSPSAHPLPRLHWDGARQEEYAEQLKGLRPSLRECHASIRRGQLQHAFQQLGDVIQQAAISAGCRHVPTQQAPQGQSQGQPVF